MTKTYNYIQEAINDKHLVMYQKYLLVLQTAHHIIATSLASNPSVFILSII